MSRKAQWPEFVWVRVPLGTKKDIKLSIEKLRSANINFAWTESEFIRQVVVRISRKAKDGNVSLFEEPY